MDPHQERHTPLDDRDKRLHVIAAIGIGTASAGIKTLAVLGIVARIVQGRF